MQPDYLIVGAGLTGATLARVLHDCGFQVQVLDRRHHVGGNVYDEPHESGIMVHRYGPHLFRTSSEKIWEFVNRFSNFYKYEHVVKTFVQGQYENWPISGSYIRRAVGENWSPEFIGEPGNFEEACLASMPRIVYERFVKGYTEKQWGVPATSMDKSLAGRFSVHIDDDPRLKSCRYQGLPEQGYHHLMQQMLRGIPILLDCDYLKHRDEFQAKLLTIYTGPIDEYFSFDLGRLTYRSQQRVTTYTEDIEYSLPAAVVNNPSPENGPHVRSVEWKYLMHPSQRDQLRGTVVTTETPCAAEDPDTFEYPFPNTENQRLYKRYRERAEEIPEVLFCGRLGEYRYYDMDQAIARALMIAERQLLKRSIESVVTGVQSAEHSVRQFQEKGDSARGTPLEKDVTPE